MIYNRIIKNASWIIVCRLIQSILSMIISIISARYLGPSNFGLISYASSLTAFIVPVIQLGLRNTLVQEIVSDSKNEGEVLGTSIGMCMFSSVVGIIGITSFASILNRGETDTIIVCSLYSVSLIFQMSEMIQYWFQAKLLSKYVSIVSLIAYGLVSLYKIFLLIYNKNVYWFALTNAIDYFIISVVLFYVYKKLGGHVFRFSFKRFKYLFSKSKYYIVSGMMVNVFSQTDKIMLKIFVNDAEVGIYSAALSCAGMTSFVFVAIIDSFRPMIFENKKKKQLEYNKSMCTLYAIVFYMALLQSVLLFITSGFVTKVLYGESYSGATNILKIITWYSAFSYMGSVRNIWVLAEEKQHLLWIINLSGAVLNVFGNLFLIPVCGANGAAISSVVTQFFTNFVLCFVIKPLRENGIMILKSLNISKVFSHHFINKHC